MITPGGQFTTLVTFNGSNGLSPYAGMILASDGNFYGTTVAGGNSGLGNIYKLTPSGSFTTVAEFSGNFTTNHGRFPYGGLIEGDDGNFYGTAFYGGAADCGAVFRVTPAGALTTLLEFTGNGSSNKGSGPRSGLVKGGDGNLYGTTAGGGEYTGYVAGVVGGPGYGTLFKMTPGGLLTTLMDFSQDGTDTNPYCPLIFGADGNLYGTAQSSVFRLIYPGPPVCGPSGVLDLTQNTAIPQGRVNARGSNTNVTLEYGTDGITFPNSILTTPKTVAGYVSTLVGATLNALIPGQTYFYRFRATNSYGTTVSAAQSFSTLAAPLAILTPANSILATSAQLNGTVNARNYATTVTFEWGTDGNSFPNQVPAAPGTVTGNTAVSVSAPIAGLTKGQTYYYRLAASNAGGTVVTGAQAFTTLTEPIAITGEANALSTTRAAVIGSVNPQGSSAAVSFEYGTDGINFPNSFSAVPDSASGSDPVAVSATLTGLQQGTTYSYRIRATGPGGTGLGATRTFSLSILSGLAQVFPDPPPSASGTVTVNFEPPTRGAWRFAGEPAWRNSGVAATNLASGQRLIEFLPLAGYIPPPVETLDVVSGGNLVLDRMYFETQTAGSGGLSVHLKPSELAAPSVPEATRAQWRFVGESQWRDSDGSPVSSLTAGNHLVECKPVTGKVTPPTASVTITNGSSSELTLTYFTANNTGAATPVPLPFSSVSADEDLPFAYVGQIRSEVGSSTGFVAKRRVVATAGHVVFDDGSLSYVKSMEWLFQRHAGQFEPKPQVPRGSYLATGYATQRITDNSPGEGSPQSQTLDYAALYFLEEAGRGGYGGFLATDLGDDNEFLTSTSQKILAGYAVDGIPAADKGKLHATTAFTAGLTPAFGETWISTAVRGYGGMSGGPLFVQRPNGLYFPAAIYLGGNGQTVVRAIDSSVVDLFSRAEVSGNGGDNNTGGGITHTSISTFGTTADPGAIKVIILPAAAASAGRWGLKPESPNRSSGSTTSGRAAGDYILELTTISGFQAPTSQNVRINGGQLAERTFTYVAPPPTITSASSASGTRGQSLTYQIVASQSPNSYALSGSLPTGLTFDTGTGLLGGTLQQAGVFIVTLGATNVGGTGTKTLVLTSRPSISNQSAAVALGQPISRQITSSESGADLNYTANDLPSGASLDEATGIITGSPLQAGIFTSLVTVTKSGASASAILTLTVTATALDVWRLANFQTTSNTGDAADGADPDKDGQTNLAEYAAGTNPNSATSVFKILTSTKNANTFTVTAAGKAARSYVLERSTTLSAGQWTNVISIAPLAADGPVALTDPATPNNSAFYRLRVSAP